MTPPQKPEWIEIADADNAATPRRVSKKLPALALIITATIIGAGAVFGQTQEQTPASAATALAPAVQSSASAQPDATNTSPSTQVLTPAVGSASMERTAPVVSTVSTQSVTPVNTPTTPTMKNPSIGTLPTKGGDDGHESNGDDEEDDD